MVIRRIARKLRRAQGPVVRVVQRVLLSASLFPLYFLGFGLTRLVMMILARRMLYHRRRRPSEGQTGWRAAVGYGLDESSLTVQS